MKAVYDILTKHGYNVSIVQPPETSLDDDVAATNRVLDAQDGPSVLVGHSYGGAIITAAGNNAHVARLVYVAAFQPDTGKASRLWEPANRLRARPSSRRPMGSCSSILPHSMPISPPTFPQPKRILWRARRWGSR